MILDPVYHVYSMCIYYAPGDDSPHGGILLLLCPVCMYVCMYVCMSEFG